MQAATRDDRDGIARACGECKAANLAGSRYCKACGATLVAPPECPACKTAVPADARFCSGCGIKLVGPRQPRATVSASRVATTSAPSVDVLTKNLPKPKPRSSNMLGNVLLFVAALSVFVVFMYNMNKDAPKEISPFEGGPAPSMGGPPAQPAQPSQPSQPAQTSAVPTAGGAPVRGIIGVDPSLANSLPPNATVFIIARNQGMPDRGPPIAVKKIDGPKFPLEFEIGPSDVMMQGIPFSGPFDLYVRLDADGNAMTKEPGDLALSQPKSGVTAGATGIAIVLDKRL